MVITPDGKMLIVAETFASRLSAFDILPDGALKNRQVWAPLCKDVFPDGICLDAEGCVWQPTPAQIHYPGEKGWGSYGPD